MKNNLIQFFTEDFNSTHAIVQKILIKDNEAVGIGENIALIESSKKVIEYESKFDGYIYWLVSEGDQIENGTTIALISQESIKNIEEFKISMSQKKYIIHDSELTFKAGKLIKTLGITQDEVSKNKIYTEKDVYSYYLKKYGVRIVDLNFHQKELVSSLMHNSYVSYVSIELDKQQVIAKKQDLANINKIEVTLDSILLLAMRLSMDKFDKVSSWIKEDKVFEDLNRNIGVYITKGTEYGQPVEINGQNCNIVDLSISLYENLTLLENQSSVKKLPCSIYLSNLTKSDSKIVIPVLKKMTSSTIVITSLEKSYLLGMSFDHRIFEGNYAIAFLSEIQKKIQNL